MKTWYKNDVVLLVAPAIMVLLILWAITPMASIPSLANYAGIIGAVISLLAFIKVILIDKVVKKIRGVYSLTVFVYREIPEFKKTLKSLREFQKKAITQSNSLEILAKIRNCKEWVQRLKNRIESSSIDLPDFVLDLDQVANACQRILSETKHHYEPPGTSGKRDISSQDITTLNTMFLNDQFTKKLRRFETDMKGYYYG